MLLEAAAETCEMPVNPAPPASPAEARADPAAGEPNSSIGRNPCVAAGVLNADAAGIRGIWSMRPKGAAARRAKEGAANGARKVAIPVVGKLRPPNTPIP